MLSWSELSKLLERTKGVVLKDPVLQTTSVDVSHYPIVAIAASASVPVAVATVAAPLEDIAPLPLPLPPIVAPKPIVAPVTAPISVAPASKVRELVRAKHTIDPIVLGMALFDPLYEGSPHSTRHKIEKEAAIKLESELDTLYKTNSGRSRGRTES